MKKATEVKKLTPLAQARKSRSMTINALSKELGINQTTYYRIEQGSSMPTVANARLIYEYFQGDVLYAQIYDPDYQPNPTKRGRKPARRQRVATKPR